MKPQHSEMLGLQLYCPELLTSRSLEQFPPAEVSHHSTRLGMGSTHRIHWWATGAARFQKWLPRA